MPSRRNRILTGFLPWIIGQPMDQLCGKVLWDRFQITMRHSGVLTRPD